MLEFEKLKEEDNSRKIVIGSCKLLDSKLEKPVNYEVILSVIYFIIFLRKMKNILYVIIKKEQYKQEMKLW